MTKEVLATLARDFVVCVVSGRALADLRLRVGLAAAYYAADHGHRILGPEGSGVDLEVGPENRHELEAAAYELERRLRGIEGAIVETKGVSLSVHYRLVAESQRPLVQEVVAEVSNAAPGLKLTTGKMVHELMPELNWDKGRAMLWLLKRLRLRRGDVCPVCLGDDLTDEDMFAAAGNWGVSVVVGLPDPDTRAGWMLADWKEVAAFLREFIPRAPGTPTRVR
jgi:trehalose-phosphatase